MPKDSREKKKASTMQNDFFNQRRTRSRKTKSQPAPSTRKRGGTSKVDRPQPGDPAEKENGLGPWRGKELPLGPINEVKENLRSSKKKNLKPDKSAKRREFAALQTCPRSSSKTRLSKKKEPRHRGKQKEGHQKKQIRAIKKPTPKDAGSHFRLILGKIKLKKKTLPDRRGVKTKKGEKNCSRISSSEGKKKKKIKYARKTRQVPTSQVWGGGGMRRWNEQNSGDPKSATKIGSSPNKTNPKKSRGRRQK